MSLRAAFDSKRDNSLNFLRLLFAVSVVLYHSIGLRGARTSGADRFHLGTIGVDFFFVVSGYLITRSWVRKPQLGRFAWHRFLRIMPGYWGCIAFITLVAGPIGWAYANRDVGHYWTNSAPWLYLLEHL